MQGKLEAKEVKVTTTPTADFLFAEDYQLPKLEEVEKYIKDKRHLPEIASAKEMQKEGVNIGEFQIKLLQKIEELTLYTIEQQKAINDLIKRITELEKKLIMKKIFLLLFFLSILVDSQTITENARATGYATVAAKNPGADFSIYIIPWDGINTLEKNANDKINPGWHAQAAIKGNYFNQGFDNSDFTDYSSLVMFQKCWFPITIKL